MRLIPYIAALFVAPLAAGIFAAVALTAHADTPVALNDLAGLGYMLSLRTDVSQSPVCANYVAVAGNGIPPGWEMVIGDPARSYCQPAGAIERRILDLLAAYPPLAWATTTAASTVPAQAVTVTVTATETTVATTNMPGTTVERTTTEPPVTIERTHEAQPVTTTLVQTVTVAAPVPLSADAASDQALADARDAGVDEAGAALAARSAWLNVTYGLA